VSGRSGTVSRRVLIVTDSFYPNQGGCERVIAESSRALRRLGHELVILTGTDDPTLPRTAHWADLEIIRYRFSSRNTWLLNLSAILGSARAVSRVLRDRRPFHLIHYHGVFGAAGARLSRRARGLPRMVTFHGPVDREFVLSQRSRVFQRRPVRRLLQRPFVALYSGWLRRLQAASLRAVSVVALSRYTAEIAASRLPARPRGNGVYIIPAGVDLARFAPSRDRPGVRVALGLPVQAHVLLTVRRLVPRMGLEQLIEAMDEVRHHDSRVHLVIGGRGPLKARLCQQVHELHLDGHVTLAGFISEDALPGYYQAADLFVLPSIDLEGFGLVTLEALACGTPVLATRTGANAELLEELGDEFLVDAPTANQLAKGILRFIDQAVADPALRHQCRAHVERRYSWPRHAEQLTALWEAMLNRDEGRVEP
jgi:glycosyltransferase involved in cell wall biosynthesis